MKIRDIKDWLNQRYDFSNKCEWDNCGLLIGDESDEITKIGFALDLTSETLTEAINNGVNLIITHHPVIFHSQKNFLKGSIAYEAAVNGINVISCHTCFDSAKNGVSEILAKTLGLSEITVIETSEKPYCVRMGRIDDISPEKLAKLTVGVLSTTVRFVKGDRIINKVAVCGGSGGDFIDEVYKSGCQAYVTGDIDHHEFLLAKEYGLTLIAAGHFETEVISMREMMNELVSAFSDIECILLKETNPVSFVSAEEK